MEHVGTIEKTNKGHFDLSAKYPPKTIIENSADGTVKSRRLNEVESIVMFKQQNQSIFSQFNNFIKVKNVCITNGDKVQAQLECDEVSCFAVDERICILYGKLKDQALNKLTKIDNACVGEKDQACVISEQIKNYHIELVESLKKKDENHRSKLEASVIYGKPKIAFMSSYHNACRNLNIPLVPAETSSNSEGKSTSSSQQ